jgi:1-acyl-sn-glycerol-3-phosphate acyltransferase
MGILRWLGEKTLKVLGWKLVGTIPDDVKKCIITVAPHTSIDDFILGRLAYCSIDKPVKFLIKKEFFDVPILKQILLKLGGIPVDRSRNNNIVNQVSAMFGKYDTLNIVIAPEGTRKCVNKWKKGFYYIALKANVPIVLGFLDFKKKELGFGPILHPTGNYEEDWKIMEDFYRGFTAKHPERYNLSN